MSGLVVRPERESDADTVAATLIAVLRPCRRLRECSGMSLEEIVRKPRRAVQGVTVNSPFIPGKTSQW